MIKVQSFLIILLLPFYVSYFHNNDTELASATDFVVVLDAGHGGHDPGNLGNGYLEKNIALNIVLEAGSVLEKNGVTVIYTRKDDSFIDLYKRGEIANKANADLFVSVHCDSHSSDAYGAGTFVLGLHANKQNFEVAKKENSVIYLEDNYEDKYSEYDINSPESVIGLTIMQEEFLDQSIQLAKFMQDNFTQSLTRKDRKVKQAGFIVLHQTFMPSVLVETGFLTNKDEGAYLNSKKGQQEMGKAIATAVLKYRDGVSTNTNSSQQIAIKTPSADNIPPADDDRPKTEVTKKEIAVDQQPKQEKGTQGKQAVEQVATSGNKQEVKKEPSVRSEPITNMAETGVVFKVQLLATSKRISLVKENFNGLDELSTQPFKNLFRYMYGNTSSYNEAEILKEQALAKGYKNAYIVSYKDGKRVPLSSVLK
jgi:N-acetylmuramoyl-L-alanine amidase